MGLIVLCSSLAFHQSNVEKLEKLLIMEIEDVDERTHREGREGGGGGGGCRGCVVCVHGEDKEDQGGLAEREPFNVDQMQTVARSQAAGGRRSASLCHLQMHH